MVPLIRSVLVIGIISALSPMRGADPASTPEGRTAGAKLSPSPAAVLKERSGSDTLDPVHRIWSMLPDALRQPLADAVTRAAVREIGGTAWDSTGKPPANEGFDRLRGEGGRPSAALP